MLNSYDEIMWNAIKDTLEEMYQNSYPKISWKQRVQDKKDGKDVDIDLINHHYIPKELFESILEEATNNYSYDKFFKEYTEHFESILLNGGRLKDLNGSKDDYKEYGSLKDEIDEESFKKISERIDAYKRTFRFDWKRWSFDHSVMNYAPSINREQVIEYWKSQGVDLQIPSDEEIIRIYYEGEDE